MIDCLVRVLLAYLAGTVIGGYWVGRLRGGIDLRQHGSGNVGATNALRTQGRWFAFAVLAIDLFKGIAAVLLIPVLPLPLTPAGGEVAVWLPFLCGLAVTVGHVFPVWFGFRGGKGAATFAGVFGALLPTTLLWMLAAFVGALLASGMVSLGTLSAAVAAVLHVGWRHGLAPGPELGFVLAAAALVFHTHRANIGRIFGGTESRFDTGRLWRKWRAR